MYFFKIDTKKILLCLSSLIFLCAFEGEKNATYFMENKEEAEQTIQNKCSEQNDEINNILCQAAKRGLEQLQEVKERESIIVEAFDAPKEEVVIKEEPKELTEDDYRKIFEKYPDKIDEIMQSKCEELFATPNYDINPDLQDIECNIAREEQERISLKKLEELQKEGQSTDKNLLYYKNNIIEARNTHDDCQKKGTSSVTCQYASIAVRELEEEKKKRESLKEYYSGNILVARDTVSKCQEETETDSLKCEIAFEIHNKNISQNRSKLKFENHLNYFRNNLDQARKLLKTKCKSYTPANKESIFVENDECEAVQEAIKEFNAKNEKIELLKVLKKYKELFISNIAETKRFNSKQFQSLIDHFNKDHKMAEDFVASCIENKARAKISALNCLAALNVITELLESATKLEEEREKAKKEYKNYYRKYFAENPTKAQELLDGRCKLVFANQWYEYDETIKDEECEAARSEQNRLNRIKKQRQMERLNALKKNEAYYIDNIDITRQTEKECRKGIIKNLHDCEMSMKTLEGIRIDESKREEYKKYYRTHILEAKYKLKWCKSNMVKFDTHCYVVFDILKDHKDKVLDEEKQKEYTEFFEQNPFEANVTLLGKCSELISNNWYFLDVNIQTEECNAAFDVIKGYD